MVHYTAEDRVKLSHHWDGFVQFSGESPGKIISGRNALTGAPKGLGLMSAPIRRPIVTGPTSGLLVWGLDDYAEHRPTARDIVFNQDEIYYRNCTPAEWSDYLLLMRSSQKLST